jgi:hypoxanthine phosphoribosyltransferase
MGKISVMLTEEQISKRVSEVAEQISKDYEGKNLLLLCVLTGAFVFASDLARKIDNENTEIAFIRAKSYIGTQSSGDVQTSGFTGSAEGKNILIVEDIIDTGLTLKKLTDKLLLDNPESIKVAVLLDKPSRRIADITADYSCFEIEDKFVVGYGLDYNEKYRSLPYVGIYSDTL